MTDTQRTWCAYVRVSKANKQRRESDNFYSPEQQESEIRRKVQGAVGPVFQDLDVSGGVWTRTGLDAALAWVREAPGERGLAAYDYSRVGRDAREFLNFVHELEGQGARVVSVMQNIDTSTPEGRLMLTNFAAQDEYYRTTVGRRWKSVQDLRLERGLVAGGQVRFGYRHVEGQQGVEPDPITGPALRQAYLDYTAGTGWQLLVKRLNDAGVLTTRGNSWSSHSLRRALDSGFGAGLLVTDEGERFLPGAHQPVITPEEWAAYQRARERRKALPRKAASPKWFLSGIGRCGRCGAGIYVTTYKQGASYVQCSDYRNKRTCPGGASMRREDLEWIVTRWIGGHITEVSAQVDTSERDGERGRVLQDIDALSTKKAEITQRLVRLASGYGKGIFDEDSYRAARAEVDAEKAALDEQVRALQDRLDALAPVGKDMYSALETLPDDDTGAWNGLIRRVIEKVVIHKKHVVLVPVVGEPVEIPKPTHRQSRSHLPRDDKGHFLKKVSDA